MIESWHLIGEQSELVEVFSLKFWSGEIADILGIKKDYNEW